MQYGAVRLRKLKLRTVKDVEVLHTNVVILVEEALLLYAGHVEHIQLRKSVLQTDHFLEWNIVLPQNVIPDIIRNPKFLRRDQDKADTCIPDKCRNQGVYGAPELEVAADAD